LNGPNNYDDDDDDDDDNDDKNDSVLTDDGALPQSQSSPSSTIPLPQSAVSSYTISGTLCRQ